jgi:5'-phosphate synthase pdxT subunit
VVGLTVGVLALQGDVPEHVAALERAGARTVLVRRPGELARVDGLVLPGGESTVIDQLLRLFELRDPLRRLIREGLPVYGSCAGLVLLADRLEGGAEDQQTLGGLDIVARRNAFGRQADSFEADLDWDAASGDGYAEGGGRGPLRAVFIRAPWIERAGDGVEVLARLPQRDVAGRPLAVGAGRIVAARQGKLLATAFHPELVGDTRVHQLFVRMIEG